MLYIYCSSLQSFHYFKEISEISVCRHFQFVGIVDIKVAFAQTQYWVCSQATSKGDLNLSRQDDFKRTLSQENGSSCRSGCCRTSF